MMAGEKQIKTKILICEQCGAQIVTDANNQTSSFTYTLCHNCKEQAILNL